jgi:L-threonylcarbamoyladenylate synthase
MAIYDTSVESELLTGMRLARQAISKGDVVVIPTDTVYGIAADAFQPEAVTRLLDAKGRGRSAPPPVLVPSAATLDALAESVPDEVHALVAEFWPGGLTVILPARGSLAWDLGDTRGTVALRMPANDIALELMAETGPLAVSSANRTGKPAAMTAFDAEAALGDRVAVYLEAGRVGTAYPGSSASTGSTIVDATALHLPEGKLRIVRHGVIGDDEIIAIVGADRCE